MALRSGTWSSPSSLWALTLPRGPGYGIFYAATPYCNRFLRTQFTLDDPAAVDAMRVLVKGGGRTEIYLNGFRIAEVLSPNSQPCMLAPDV